MEQSMQLHIFCRQRTDGWEQCEGRDGPKYFAYWKHWPCLFPQHGPGPKHLRQIVLQKWQQGITSVHPEQLLRGLIHSDGCRGLNRISCHYKSGPRSYAYPRYLFTNNSPDIRRIFCEGCEAVGVSWRQMNWKTVSVNRHADVAKLDQFIGPKR
jgi:hypothetical protein